jgi:hypothetical protein
VLSLRSASAALVVVLVAAGLGMVVLDEGEPATKVDLGVAAVWLPSIRTGGLTLLDGPTAEVATTVAVARPRTRVLARQLGTVGYAVDPAAGTVVRVDGASWQAGDANKLIDGSAADIDVVVSHRALYVLDRARSLVTQADPRSLARRGQALRANPTSAVSDATGDLWTLDAETGDLRRIAGQGMSRWEGVATGALSQLLEVGRRSVLVDAGRRTLRVLGADGPGAKVKLDVDKSDNTLRFGSSLVGDTVLAASGQHGTLTTADLHDSHTLTVEVAPVEHVLGAPVEAQGHAFVPDLTTGRVAVVDLDSHEVMHTAPLVPPSSQVQLLSRDGFVFYNDPSSERAGVIELDGTVHPVQKYDPKSPDTVRPRNGRDGETQRRATKPDLQVTPPPVQDQRRPETTDHPSEQPSRGPLALPTDDGTADSTTDNGDGPPGSTTTNPTGPPRIDSVGYTPRLPARGSPVRFQARVRNAADATWTWTLTAEDGSTVRVSHAVGGFTHTFPVAGGDEYQVRLRLTSLRGSATSPYTHVQLAVHSSPPEKRTLTVTVVGNGRTNHCGSGTCHVDFDRFSSVTETATPSPGYTFYGWEEDCAGMGKEPCDLGMDVDHSVTARFGRPLTVDITISGPGTVTSDSPDVTCDRQGCTGTVTGYGTTVTLTPSAQGGASFGGWGGDCDGDAKCALTMTEPRTATATFDRDATAPKLTLHVKYRGQDYDLKPGEGDVTEHPGLDPSETISWDVAADDGPGGSGIKRTSVTSGSLSATCSRSTGPNSGEAQNKSVQLDESVRGATFSRSRPLGVCDPGWNTSRLTLTLQVEAEDNAGNVSGTGRLTVK